MSITIEVLKAGGPYLGAIVPAVGLGLVYRQLRLNRILLESQTRGLVYQLSHGAYRMFIDKPHLRPFFYDEAPLPEVEPARSEVLATAELLTDFFEHIAHADQTLSRDVYDSWIVYMREVYLGSPVLRNYLDTTRRAYTGRLRGILLG